MVEEKDYTYISYKSLALILQLKINEDEKKTVARIFPFLLILYISLFLFFFRCIRAKLRASVSSDFFPFFPASRGIRFRDFM